MTSKETLRIEATLEWVEASGGCYPDGGYVRVLVPSRLDPALDLTTFRTRKDAEEDPVYGPAVLRLFEQNRPLADDEYLTSIGKRHKFVGAPTSGLVRVRGETGREWFVDLVADAWTTREAFERAKAYHAKHYKPPEPSPLELRLVSNSDIVAGKFARFHSPTREGYSVEWGRGDNRNYKIGSGGAPNVFYDQWPTIREWHSKAMAILHPPEFDPVDPFGLGKKDDVLVGGWQPISVKPERGRRVVFYGVRTSRKGHMYSYAWSTRLSATYPPTWATHWTYAPEVKP